MSDRAQKNDSQLIFGRNAVLEAIKAGVAIDKLYVAPVEQRGSMGLGIGPAEGRKSFFDSCG